MYCTILYCAVLYCNGYCTVPYGKRLALLAHLPAGSGQVALQLQQLPLQQVPRFLPAGLTHSTPEAPAPPSSWSRHLSATLSAQPWRRPPPTPWPGAWI